MDRVISISGMFTTSIPEMATAMFLMVVFVFGLGWLPGTTR